jgi:hypothetical protein
VEDEARAFQNTGSAEIGLLAKPLWNLIRETVEGRSALLDYGSGYGDWLQVFNRCNPHFRYQVYEPDAQARDCAEAVLPGRHDSSLSSFDRIVCFAVLELLPPTEQHRILREFRGRLRLGGSVLIQYNVYNRLSPRWVAMALRSGGRAKQFHQSRRFDRSYLSSSEVEALFKRAGFRVVTWATNRLHHRLPRALDRSLQAILRSKRFHSQIFYRLVPAAGGGSPPAAL